MRSHENKSDMSGDIVHNSHSVTLLSSGNSPIYDKKKIKLTPDGGCSPLSSQQNDISRLGDGWRPICISNSTKDSKSQCWPGEQPSPLQHCCSQNCLGSAMEPSLHLSNSRSHSLLNTNNSSAPHSRQKKMRNVHHKAIRNKQPRIPTGKNSQNRKVTDYYPIRRSSRKSKTELKDKEKQIIDKLITNGTEEGMEVRYMEGKGRAVFATRCFQKGDYVVEYHGELLHITDAKKRETEYAQNPATGCYMYYFQYLSKTYCVDATKETGRMGRLINHSKNGNCQTKLHDINGIPHLILIASRDIDKDEELLYDYGDRSKASIAAHPWLKY